MVQENYTVDFKQQKKVAEQRDSRFMLEWLHKRKVYSLFCYNISHLVIFPTHLNKL